MYTFILSIFTCIITMFISATSSAAFLSIDSSGVLAGATGVNVLGQSYDVSFDKDLIGSDGGFNAIFPTMLDADAAAHALIDEVFVEGNFTDLTRVQGCGDPTSCTLFTVYQTDPVATFGFRTILSSPPSSTSPKISGDVAFSFTSPADVVFQYGNKGAFAHWTSSITPVAPVPLPAAALLFFSSLFGLGGLKISRKK